MEKRLFRRRLPPASRKDRRSLQQIRQAIESYRYAPQQPTVRDVQNAISVLDQMDNRYSVESLDVTRVHFV